MKIALFTTETRHHAFYAKNIKRYCSELYIYNELKNLRASENNNNYINQENILTFQEKQNLYEEKLWFEEKKYKLHDIAKTFSFDSLSSDDAIQQINKTNYDVGFVYGTTKLSKEFINSFKAPLYNFHGGDPELYRGLDSHLWSIYHKDKNGLVLTMHLIDEILDNGKIIFKTNIPILEDSELFQLRSITTYECINLTRITINCIKNSINLPLISQVKKGRYYSSIPAELIQKCELNFDNMFKC